MALLATVLQDCLDVLRGKVTAAPVEVEQAPQWVLGNHGRFTFVFAAEACGLSVEAARKVWLEAERRRGTVAGPRARRRPRRHAA